MGTKNEDITKQFLLYFLQYEENIRKFWVKIIANTEQDIKNHLCIRQTLAKELLCTQILLKELSLENKSHTPNEVFSILKNNIDAESLKIFIQNIPKSLDLKIYLMRRQEQILLSLERTKFKKYTIKYHDYEYLFKCQEMIKDELCNYLKKNIPVRLRESIQEPLLNFFLHFSKHFAIDSLCYYSHYYHIINFSNQNELSNQHLFHYMYFKTFVNYTDLITETTKQILMPKISEHKATLPKKP